MAASFLDLPWELREEIYRLIIPVQQRDQRGNLLVIHTDQAFEFDLRSEITPLRYRDEGSFQWGVDPYPPPKTVLSSEGVNILKSCRQISQEAAPFVYGQQQFVFFRPAQALRWLNRIGRYNWASIQHVTLRGVYVQYHKTFRGARARINRVEYQKAQIKMWLHALRGMPDLKSLECGTKLNIEDYDPILAKPIWGDPDVVNFLRTLRKISSLRIGAARPGCISSLQLTDNKPHLENLVLEGNLELGDFWYIQDYFDRLPRLKHLWLEPCIDVQRGIYRLPLDFFTHVAPLESFAWHGRPLNIFHSEAFVARHGSKLRCLDLHLNPRSKTSGASSRFLALETHFLPSDKAGVYAALSHLLSGLSVLKSLRLKCLEIGAEVIQLLPPTIRVLDGWFAEFSIQRWDNNLMDLLQICPLLLHLRLYVQCSPRSCEQSNTWHDAVHTMKLRGVKVVSPTCEASGCTSVGYSNQRNDFNIKILDEHFADFDWRHDHGISSDTPWNALRSRSSYSMFPLSPAAPKHLC